MTIIYVQKVNDVYLRVTSDDSVEAELSDYFKHEIPGAKFTPKYKQGFWDGFARLFNLGRKTLYVGLYDYIVKFAERNSYEIQVVEGSESLTSNNNLNIDEVTTWIRGLEHTSRGQPVEVYDHQIRAIFAAVNEDRITLESPTSSGKSLIIYSIIRWHLEHNRKILVIVPTTQLCEQMYSDFNDYSSTVEWDVGQNVQRLYSGFSKEIIKPVLVSTWQSLIKQPPSYYEQFDAVICDEVHLAKGASITSILEQMKETPYRVGLTGTLDDSKCNRLQVCGLFGRQFKVISTRELMDAGKVVELDIKCLVLSHTEEDRKLCNKAEYKAELDFVVTMTKRNRFIANLAMATKGNTLILCTWVSKHIIPLSKMIQDMAGDRPVYVIYGDIPPIERENIRLQLENETNAITIASFSTCSTGINIPSIENIILAASSKSKIRNLQSIGRGLRLKKGKNKCKLFDIADDLTWKKNKNHVMRHFEERISQYAKEQFNYKIMEVKI